MTINRAVRRRGSKRMERITFNIGGGKVRVENLEGRKHLVVPCVMITEGVHEGDRGPGLYTEKDTAPTANSWDHMPVVVYHPKKGNRGVSARQPKVLNARKVGIVLNARWDDKGKRMKNEVWLDYDRTKKIDSRVLKAVEGGKKVEVSTGLFLNRVKKRGVWNGEEYEWVAKDQRPDHLAVLPDQKGACSVKDGAGLLQNAAGGKSLHRLVGVLRDAGLVKNRKTGRKLTANDASFSDITNQLTTLLGAACGEPGKSWPGYVCEVYDGKAVFRTGYGYDSPMMMTKYHMDGDKVILDGDPQEVQRVVEYKTVNNGRIYLSNSGGSLALVSNKGAKMLTRKKKVGMVRRLIANSGGVWTAEDKATLMKMPDVQLKKIVRTAEVAEANADSGDDDRVANAVRHEADRNGFKADKSTRNKKGRVKPPTEDEWLKKAPPSVRAVFNQGRRALENRKEALIETIVANDNNKFSEKYLRKQDVDLLEGLAHLARNSAGRRSEDDEDGDDDGMFVDGFRPDYSGAVGAAPVGNRRRGRDEDEEDGLSLPTLYRNSSDDDDKDDKKGKKGKKSA